MHKGSIGILGLNSRAVAESAKKCGFKVYLIDYFSDSDVIADYHFFLQRNPVRPNLSKEYSAKKLAEFAIENLDGVVDNLILTSGIGCNFRIVKKLERHFEILGNSSAKIRNSKDWINIKRILDKIGVSYPKTIVARSARDVRGAVNKLEYPVVVKSMIKSTGILPRLIRNEIEMEKFCRIIKKILLCKILTRNVAEPKGLRHVSEPKVQSHTLYCDKNKRAEILVQKYIDGIPISVSLLSDGKNAISLSVNRQLIGVKEFGALMDFTYCGHIVPLDKKILHSKILIRNSEEIISNLKLLGSNGIDYVLSNKGIFFMEVNPRFQDTISSVEKFCKINLVEKHLKAIEPKGFSHILEYPKNHSGMCYGKGIVFAERRTIVSGLKNLPDVSNIPHDGTIIQKGEPICSIFAEGKSNEDVMNKLFRKAEIIKENFIWNFSGSFLKKKVGLELGPFSL